VADSAPKAAGAKAPSVDVTLAQPADGLEGERKTVTALFADIRGSTALIEDLDPEAAHAVVDPVLRIMVEAVHRYEGYVVRTTGDGIFALFGAPVAHEDHPQRALSAALRLQQELHAHGQGRIAQGLHPLEARVGVHTGEVVAHTVETDGKVEYRLVGHAANLAARMEMVAPTGSIAASEYTRKLCEGYFTFKRLGPMVVKGVAEPVAVYEVTGFGPLRTRLQRAVARGLTKFVGRQREMEALQHGAEQAEAGHGQIVAVMAEPGVGKSRLFYEFKATSQSGWMVLEAYSVSHGKASSYVPVIELLHNYFRIMADDDPRQRRQKVIGKLLELDRALEDVLPYLFALLGLNDGDDPMAHMDAQIRRRRTQEGLKRIFLRESLQQPLVMIFEDLHWIDPDTQAVLNLLADSIVNARILLLVNYRPEYRHEWGHRTHYTQLRLDPLSAVGVGEMLAALLGPGDELEPLKRLIALRTEGNPFFIEEIVLSLFDKGVLVRDGFVRLAERPDTVKVPETVQAVIASRIDRLPAGEKELLQILSVIGKEIPASLVRAVWQSTREDRQLDLERMLDDLQLAEFIHEQPSVGEPEFTFKHALTQEVAYNSILKEKRKQIHRRIGQALESLFPTQVEDYLNQLAHHYSSAEDADKSVEYLGRAGQRAAKRSAYANAASRLEEAVAWLRKLPPGPESMRREVLLQLALGPALVAVKGGWAVPEVQRAYARAQELCGRLNDPPELFTSLNGVWAVHALRGELHQANKIAGQLLRLAQVRNDHTLLLYANYALGFNAFYAGEFLDARQHLESAVGIYNDENHGLLALQYGFDAALNSSMYLAWTLWHLGYPSQALERAYEARAQAERRSVTVSLPFAEAFVGAIRQCRGEVSGVKESAEKALASAEKWGVTEALPIASALRGWAIAKQGLPEEGMGLIKQGLSEIRDAGMEAGHTYLVSLLADICKGMSGADARQSASLEVAAVTNEHQVQIHDAELYRLKGELRLRDDPRSAEAQSCFAKALDIARKQNAKSLELRAVMSLVRSPIFNGKRPEARVMLADIYNWFTEGFDTADLKEAKALLAQLNG
jgi:class 3 adenylate cyclase/predicted ATPase